ncbi:hypothetical protein [Microscilla marina]|uniref:Uncharacterized protein n=1 Tax=Microscilla marina ATCC 23134 TaxID=313606 RepID=A1ZME6_MICM2|nr:hypothetical protein [Microscilla marina]EAY28326.1 hypothetical protein M23134_03878 [Microscilla marina ATCC 23134]
MNNSQQLLQKIKQARSATRLTTQNPYDEQHEAAKWKDYYEKAQHYMEGKSYLERRLVWFKLSKGFRAFYHPVSVVLALVTATLLATRHLKLHSLGPISIFLLLLTLACLLVIFGALEWGKKEKATDVFYRQANGRAVPLMQWLYLGLLVFASLLVSALGGALIGDAQTNENKNIMADKVQAIQRVKTDHQTRLQQLAKTIAGLESLSVDPKVRRWGLTKAEQENLRAGKAEKAKLEQQQSQQIARLETRYGQRSQINHYYRHLGMGIGFSVVLMMELFLIYAYYFHNAFMKRVEAEGRQHAILPLPEEAKEGVLPHQEIITAVTQGLQTGFSQLINVSDSTTESEGRDQRKEISLRPRGKPDPVNRHELHDSLMNNDGGGMNKSGVKSKGSHDSLMGGMNKSGVKSKDCHDSLMNNDGGGMNKSGVKSKDCHDSLMGGGMNKSDVKSKDSHDSLMDGMNNHTTPMNKSGVKSKDSHDSLMDGMNKSGVKSKDCHDSLVDGGMNKSGVKSKDCHDSLMGGGMNKSGVKSKDCHDSLMGGGMNKSDVKSKDSHDSLMDGMNNHTTPMNKSGVKSKDSHDSLMDGMNKSGVKSKDCHDSLVDGGMNKSGVKSKDCHDSLVDGGMNKSGVKSKDCHDSLMGGGMNKSDVKSKDCHDSLMGGMNKSDVKSKDSHDSLMGGGMNKSGVKQSSKKTGRNGYYISPICFDRYYEGRNRADEPYRKLHWYEAVIPDLMKGVKYGDILEKQYQVYDFRQDRYVVKNISDTTLRSTIVAQLKSLENM